MHLVDLGTVGLHRVRFTLLITAEGILEVFVAAGWTYGFSSGRLPARPLLLFLDTDLLGNLLKFGLR